MSEKLWGSGWGIGLLALLFPLCAMADDNDFGTWGEVSITRRLPHNLSIGLDMDVRVRDNVQTFDRWSAGIMLGYKPLKWLKLNAGYTFMQSYTEHKRKEHYKDDIVSADYWNGYNVTSDYLTPKHRIIAMATFTSPKIGKWIRVSLRERYQFTTRPEQVVDRYKYRFNYTPGGGFTPKAGSPEYDPDTKKSAQRHALRSRLKVEMDKKKIAWHPFVSAELYNDLKDKLRLTDWRLGVGTSWDVKRDHSISAAYIYNVERGTGGDDHLHAINIGYEFKF